MCEGVSESVAEGGWNNVCNTVHEADRTMRVTRQGAQ